MLDICAKFKAWFQAKAQIWFQARRKIEPVRSLQLAPAKSVCIAGRRGRCPLHCFPARPLPAKGLNGWKKQSPMPRPCIEHERRAGRNPARSGFASMANCRQGGAQCKGCSEG